jgi:hypothetical protein
MADTKDFTTWHEEMIKGNYQRSTQNEKDIELLEKADISLKAELKSVCTNVNALTKVLWALATGIFITLLAEIVKSFV